MKITLNQIRLAFQVIGQVIRPYRGTFLLVICLVWMKSLLEAILPILFLPLIHELLGTETMAGISGLWNILQDWCGIVFGIQSTIARGLIIVFVVSLLKCAVGMLYSYNYLTMVHRYARDMRDAIFGELVHTRWLHFLNKRVGDSIDTVIGQVERSRLCLNDVVSLMDLSFVAIMYIVAAAYISYVTIVAALGAVLLIAVIIVPLAYLSKVYGKKLIQVNHNLTHHLDEILSGLKIVKACRMEQVATKLVSRQTDLTRKYMTIVDLFRQIPTYVLEFFIIFGILAFVIFLKSYQLVPLPEAAVTAMILYRCFTRVSSLQLFWVRIFQNLPSINHVIQFKEDYIRNRETDTGMEIDTFQTLELKDLHFHYVADKPVLQGLNISIQHGELIGIVGSSGAGKTTLVDTILAFLPPVAGNIFINGIDLSDINPHAWRNLIGYVPQDAVMFNESVRDNILLGRKDIDEDRFQWAVKTAHVDDFIEQLPDGYSSVIGGRGSKISGGQKQRIAFARALVRKPQLLILDEVTSAVDAHTEKRLQDSLDQLRGDVTMIVIAHRLATVMKSDRIMVLRDGQVAESGSPSELLEQKGLFSELVSLQNLT